MASSLETGPSRQSSSSRMERSQRASSWERMGGGVGIVLDTIPPKVDPEEPCAPLWCGSIVSLDPPNFYDPGKPETPPKRGSGEP